MNIKIGTHNQALSGVLSAMLSDDNKRVEVRTQNTINKNFGATRAKRTLTLINSTLELPVKEFRRIGRKLCHINARTYS